VLTAGLHRHSDANAAPCMSESTADEMIKKGAREGGHVEEVGLIRILRTDAVVPQQAPQEQLVRLVDGVERLRSDGPHSIA